MTERGTFRLFLEAAARAASDECIYWVTQKTRRPTAKFGGRTVPAARAVWIIANGDPGDLNVLHTCNHGIEGCLNIRHLYVGTQADNNRDCQVAGRNTKASLTPERVIEIRRRHIKGHRGNVAELAAEFGVSVDTIRDAASGKRYGHITPHVAGTE